MADRSLTIKIIGDASSAKTAFAQIDVSAGKTESSIGRIATTAAGFAIGGALTQLPGLLLDSAKGAAEDALALDALALAVKNTGGSFEAMSPAIDQAITDGQKLAFTDGETAKALQLLTEMTGSGEEAMNRLGPAMDLARAKGISLEQASKLLGKVSDENTTALRKLGVVVEDGATAQDVLNQVDKQFAGQAGLYAESSAVQLAIAGQQAGELAETFGGALIPVISLATAGLLLVVGAVQEHVVPAFETMVAAVTPIVTVIGGFVADNIGPLLAGLAGIAAAILAVMIPALIAWVVGMIPVIAAHVAMAAAVVVAYAPIIAIVLAVGVAVAALYLAWESNLFGIRDITQQVLDYIGPYFDATVNAIRTVVEVVFPIIAQVVTTYIAILKYEIETALAIVQTVFNTVFPVIQSIVETVFPIIATVATTYIGILKAEIELAINAVKWIFDNVFVPIQGVVSDVMTTVAELVTTAMGTIQTVIGVMLTEWNRVWGAVKATVDALWNGATGAVALIASGLQAAKDVFSGVYDTFYGYGASIKDGLIAGMRPVVDAINAIIDGIMAAWDRIPDFLKPGSPSKWAIEMGRSVTDGLVVGMRSGMPALAATVGGVNATIGASGGTASISSGGGAMVARSMTGAIGGGQIDYDRFERAMERAVKHALRSV